MAWHAQQISGQGHQASTTSVAAGGVAMRSRGHACQGACVAGPTRARVHACLRARARMRRVHVHAHSHADARVRMCMGPHEGIRLYMYVGVHE